MKSLTIIGDFQNYRSLGDRQVDRDLRRLGVLAGIIQRLLVNPEQGQPGFIRKVVRLHLQIRLDFEIRVIGQKCIRMRTDGRYQPEPSQRGRPEAAGKIAQGAHLRTQPRN